MLRVARNNFPAQNRVPRVARRVELSARSAVETSRCQIRYGNKTALRRGFFFFNSYFFPSLRRKSLKPFCKTPDENCYVNKLRRNKPGSRRRRKLCTPSFANHVMCDALAWLLVITGKYIRVLMCQVYGPDEHKPQLSPRTFHTQTLFFFTPTIFLQIRRMLED